LCSDIIERDDGTLVLPTNADPAGAGHQRLGFRRLSVGLDVGGRGNDPSALTIVKAESRPYLTGRGWEQALTPPKYTIVYTESARLAEATDVVDWTVAILRKLKHWRLTFDASGLGAPLVSMFSHAKVPALGVTFTAGSTFNRNGNTATVSKTLAYENLASKFETGELIIAHDLPERQELLNELQSIEYAESSSGRLTLKAGGRGHHADRVSALVLSLIAETQIAPQRMSVGKLRGYF
jgi:hypothetical protein